MTVPEGEDIVVPDVFDQIVVDSRIVFILHLLATFISPLDQNCSQIVYPFPSLFGSSSFQVESAVWCGDGETKRVEFVGNFVLSHHCRTNAQTEVRNV